MVNLSIGLLIVHESEYFVIFPAVEGENKEIRRQKMLRQEMAK